jgi:hypothetical protein
MVRTHVRKDAQNLNKSGGMSGVLNSSIGTLEAYGLGCIGLNFDACGADYFHEQVAGNRDSCSVFYGRDF